MTKRARNPETNGDGYESYRAELRALVSENGVLNAKSELLAILATIHNRDMLKKGGKVLDLLNGLLVVFRDNEGKHDQASS